MNKEKKQTKVEHAADHFEAFRTETKVAIRTMRAKGNSAMQRALERVEAIARTAKRALESSAEKARRAALETAESQLHIVHKSVVKAEHAVRQAEHKVERLASKAEHAVSKAEHAVSKAL